MRRRLWPVPDCRMECMNRKQRIRKWPEIGVVSAPFRIRNVGLLNKAVISPSLALLIYSFLHTEASVIPAGYDVLSRNSQVSTKQNNKTSSRTNLPCGVPKRLPNTRLVPNHMHRYSHHRNQISTYTTSLSFLTIRHYKSYGLQSCLDPPFSNFLRF